jgi:hypothetical protein
VSQCLKSSDYDVENACYVCPVVNSTGTFYFCGSLPFLGYGLCGEPGAFDARVQACNSIGGSTSAGTFTCQFSAGSIKNQTTECTSCTTITTSPTQAPTNTGSFPLPFIGLLGFSLFVSIL